LQSPSFPRHPQPVLQDDAVSHFEQPEGAKHADALLEILYSAGLSKKLKKKKYKELIILFTKKSKLELNSNHDHSNLPKYIHKYPR